jgi:hypothetical protein
MRKSIPVAFLLLLITAATQAQSWRWAKRGGGSYDEVRTGRDDETVIDMATDKNGNLYVLSNLYPESNDLDVAGTSLSGYGVTDIVVSSFKCDGTLRWNKVIGATADDRAVAIKTDTLGGVYVAGSVVNWMNTVQFGNDTSIASNAKSLFVIKYDTSGVYKWLRRPEPDTLTYAGMLTSRRIWDMDVDNAGNIFLMAELRPGAYANGGYAITDTSVNILKYDRTGTFQGGFRMAINYNPSDNALSALTFRRNQSTGNIYVTGRQTYLVGPLHFGTTLVDKAMFLGAFTAAGAFQWVRQGTVGGIPGLGRYLHRPVLDAAGNIYVGGNTYHGDSFAGFTFTNTFSTLAYKLSVMLKLDAAGNLIWGKNSSGIGVFGEGPASTHGASAIAGNEVAIADGYGGTLKWSNTDSVTKAPGSETDVFITRFNTTTGAVIKIDTLSSNFNGVEYATGMTADRNGSFYVGGSMNDELHLNGTITSKGGHADFFVGKYGYACNCTVPLASFNKTIAGRSITFTYTGTTTGVDSVVWNFGNGITQKKTGAAIGTPFIYTYPANGSYNACATAYNSCGGNQACQNISLIGAGISNASGAENIKVYPNPASEYLVVEGGSEGSNAVLLNLLGQPVTPVIPAGSKATLSLSGLPAGNYLLQLTDREGRRYIQHILKQQ